MSCEVEYAQSVLVREYLVSPSTVFYESMSVKILFEKQKPEELKVRMRNPLYAEEWYKKSCEFDVVKLQWRAPFLPCFF